MDLEDQPTPKIQEEDKNILKFFLAGEIEQKQLLVSVPKIMQDN